MLQKIETLSLRQKIGQLFWIGLPGVGLDDVTRELLTEIEPGGICLFTRNIREAKQTRKLLDDVREISFVEPLISVDQEGGLVDRFRKIIEPMPAASSLRNSNDAQTLANITAEVLAILGFNINFAPVVDVLDEERSKAQNGLQSRGLGKSKEEVVEYSTEYLAALQSNNILGCIKHFPGLGASKIDAHEDLPSVNISEDEFFTVDQFAYRELLKTNLVRCVMVAHTAFPNLDLQETDSNGKLLPSSLSFNFITKLLREKLGFNGLVVTDDMEMGAILRNYGIGEACKMAIKAGEDMLLICANVLQMRDGFNAVFEAVNTGEISEERIDESLKRIASIKSLMRPPSEFSENRLRELSGEIVELKLSLRRSELKIKLEEKI
jgi:beta-N-acetylhexosaminidase